MRSSYLERYTEIGARTSAVVSTMDGYCSDVNDSNVIYATIGHDAPICHGAIIRSGHDTGAIVAGNPAKPVRRRFPEATA